jgi:hypothetical protein
LLVAVHTKLPVSDDCNQSKALYLLPDEDELVLNIAGRERLQTVLTSEDCGRRRGRNEDEDIIQKDRDNQPSHQDVDRNIFLTEKWQYNWGVQCGISEGTV